MRHWFTITGTAASGPVTDRALARNAPEAAQCFLRHYFTLSFSTLTVHQGEAEA